MAKLTLSNLTNISGNEASAITTINNNSDAIETAIENTLSRDGTSPNSMDADFDLNSNDLLNGGNIDTHSITADTIESTDYTQDGISIITLLLEWEGLWATSTAYHVGSLVETGGSSFICILAHTSTVFDQPGTGINWHTYWDLVAQKGGLGTVAGPGTSTDNAIVRYDGTLGNTLQNSGVLISDTNVVTGATQLGVNATPDSTNKLSVNSAAVLFNHNGTTSQVKVNKAAAADTASHLFQTGFSTRAEVGNIGDANFTMKTSPDGSAFTTGLTIASADAAVAIPTNLTLSNTGLHLFDTDASHDLIIKPGSNLTADRTLTLTTGDTDRTLTLTANSSIGGTAYVSGGTDVIVADGGTGVSSLTAYAVICGGTTTTNPVQSIAGVGTSGQVLTSNGPAALPTFQAAASGGLVFLTSGTVSAQATLPIVLTSYTTYRGIVIELINIIPVTDDNQLLCRLSTNGGSSYDSGASNYLYTHCVSVNGVTETQSAAATSIRVAGSTTGSVGVGNGTAEGVSATVKMMDQTNAAVKTRIACTAGFYAAGDLACSAHSSGLRNTAQDTDAIQFLFTTGNIASGSYAVYGLA